MTPEFIIGILIGVVIVIAIKSKRDNSEIKRIIKSIKKDHQNDRR